MSSDIIAKCMAISMSHFLNTPYKEQSVIEMYAPDGFENRASGICHYCSIDTFRSILLNGCLRFSDVRFLNDSTEFIEIILLIENVLSNRKYSLEFRNFILESEELKELKEYRQSYVGVSAKTHTYEQKMYRTYTCSFSTEKDSLSMWNYYASAGNGISIAFDHSWNMFEGSNKTEVNIAEKLENDIIIYRGLIIYKDAEKKKCLMELFDRLQEIYDDAKNDIEKYRGFILFAFKQSVNHMRCFFKNESFKCENEYRIVLRIPEEMLMSKNSSSDIAGKGQFIRGNILIPYVDYKFKKSSIETITLNPYIKENDSIFKLGIEELLWDTEIRGVDIIYSGIPIRKYN